MSLSTSGCAEEHVHQDMVLPFTINANNANKRDDAHMMMHVSVLVSLKVAELKKIV